VAYTPDWEPLADALSRVIATGASEDEAKTDLCRAVADRKIGVRVAIAASDHGMRGKVFCNGNVGVPPHLGPGDLDWVRSRPLAQWSIGPKLGEHYAWFGGWENRWLDLIELSTGDVMNVLCGGADPSARRVGGVSKSGLGAKARGIAEAISQLWPNQFPKGLSAKDRNNLIIDRMKQNGSSIPSERAIQRVLQKRQPK
jgi:hypothetical protein